MQSQVSFVEIGSKDAQASSSFFGALFGWEFHAMKAQGGWFQTPTMRIGLHSDDPEPQMLVFFSVPDLEAAAALVRTLGGHAEEPGGEEPGFGRFCLCRDPQGVPFGLHANTPSREMQKG